MGSVVYSALATPTSTRLVEILFDSDEKPTSTLNLRLSQVDLEEVPIYDAISYTWGTDIATDPVRINGQPVAIRQNLFNFLSHLRDQKVTSKMFVDAISIRQDDNVEKSKQVGIIGRIFREAQKVLVWVGQHADGSEALFDSRPSKKRKPTARDNEKRLSIWLSFLQRPYFTRLWIVQELVLAKDITVQCGTSVKPWKDLIRYSTKFLLTSKDLASVMSYKTDFVAHIVWDDIDLDKVKGPTCTAFREELTKLLFLLELRASRTVLAMSKTTSGLRVPPKYQAEIYQIAHLGIRSLGRGCVDRRDYVYALLTLDVTPELHAFYPDYSIDEAELFIRICLTRLSAWKPSWAESFTKEDQVTPQALFVARLDRILLYEREMFRKAITMLVNMYYDDSTQQDDRDRLTFIAHELQSNKWATHNSSAVIKSELTRIDRPNSVELTKLFRRLIDGDMIWRTGDLGYYKKFAGSDRLWARGYRGLMPPDQYSGYRDFWNPVLVRMGLSPIPKYMYSEGHLANEVLTKE